MKLRPSSISFLILFLLLGIAIFVLYVVETDYWPFAFHKDFFNSSSENHSFVSTTTAAPSNHPRIGKTNKVIKDKKFVLPNKKHKVQRNFMGRIAMLTNQSTGQFIPDIPLFPEFSQLAVSAPYYSLLPVMLLFIVGISLLFSNIRCSSFSGSAMVLFLASFSFIWAALVVPWITQALFNDPSEHEKVNYNITLLIEICYGALAMVIAYGAVIGHASSLQALVLVFFGVVGYGTVRGLTLAIFLVPDYGGSITVFFFGGMYGVLVAALQYRFEDHDECTKVNYKCLYNIYERNITSFIGTLLIIAVFPYYCSFYLPTTFVMFSRAIVNGVFSTLTGVTSAFFFSAIVSPKQKFDLIHVQRATLAGGIAVASVAPLYLEVWGAVLLGFAAGMFTVIAFKIHEHFVKNLVLIDTGAVFATFVAPGFIGSLAAIIMASLIDSRPYEPYELLLLYPATVSDIGLDAFATADTQAAYTFYALITALCVAFVTALVVALINRWLWPYKPGQNIGDCRMFVMPFSDTLECENTCATKCEEPQKTR